MSVKKSQVRAATTTKPPHFAWCTAAGCDHKWLSPRAARLLTAHVNATGNHGVAVSAVHIRPAPERAGVSP